MLRFFTLLLFLSAYAGHVHAQATITWSEHVAPILYNHCVSCHREDGQAPFPLITYQEAVNYHHEIEHAVSTRHMPPWGADPAYRYFVGANYLSETQIQTIKDWITGGHPEGNPLLAPMPPTFDDQPAATPDTILKLPLYISQATPTNDVYPTLFVKTGFTEDRFVRKIEFVPGNIDIVHHADLFQRPYGVHPDSAGYYYDYIHPWSPGSDRLTPPLRPEFGTRIRANAQIATQLHYPAGSGGQLDQSSIHLYFNPPHQPVREVVPGAIAGEWNLTEPLVIPADSVKTFYGSYVLSDSISLVSLSPHMHIFGKSMRCFATTPEGDTIRIIDVPHFNFHFQYWYTFPKLLPLFPGYTIHLYATYDNTANNELNPFSPPIEIVAGNRTTDEMCILFSKTVRYQAGDEFLSTIDSAAVSIPGRPQAPAAVASLLVSPNPASGQTRLQFELPEAAQLQFGVYDLLGRAVLADASAQAYGPGRHERVLPLAGLPPGIYHLDLRDQRGGRSAAKLVVAGP